MQFASLSNLIQVIKGDFVVMLVNVNVMLSFTPVFKN